MKNLISSFAILLFFSSCSIRTDILYHSDATIESKFKMKINEETLTKINEAASKKDSAKTAEKKDEFEKYLNKKHNLNDFLVEKHFYDSVPINRIAFFEKINFEITAVKDKDEKMKEVSTVSYTHLTLPTTSRV